MFIVSTEKKLLLSFIYIVSVPVFICIGIYLHDLIVLSASCILLLLSFILYNYCYVLLLDKERKERVEKNRINKKEVSHEQG